jgi:hypothetical protein
LHLPVAGVPPPGQGADVAWQPGARLLSCLIITPQLPLSSPNLCAPPALAFSWILSRQQEGVVFPFQ